MSDVAVQYGWVCPFCRNVYAPSMKVCHCQNVPADANKQKITASTPLDAAARIIEKDWQTRGGQT